jgi:antitoxin component of MazEF toxin-antitoxin module
LCIQGVGRAPLSKKLIKHGNSLALIIDKPILDLLHITSDTPLELTSNGDAILVTPVRNKKSQRRLQASLDKINQNFGEDLQRLAE